MLHDVLGVSSVTRDVNKVFTHAPPARGNKYSSHHPLTNAVDVSKLVLREEKSPKSGRQHWELRHLTVAGIQWPRWMPKCPKKSEILSGSSLPTTTRARFAPLLYNDETYASEIIPISATEWSKEETDYLINLCLDLDLRWPVILDRYQWPPVTSAEEEGDMQESTRPFINRDVEQLKHRFYSVCFRMSQYLARHDQDKALSFGLFKFDPKAEKMRKEKLEARYEVNFALKDTENRLRHLIQTLQERLKEERGDVKMKVERERDTVSSVKGKANDNKIAHSATGLESHSGDFVNDEFQKIEKSLLPIMSASAAAYKGKGVTLVSTLIRQSSEILFQNLLPAHKKGTTKYAPNAPQSHPSSVAGGDNPSIGICGQRSTVNIRDLSDNIHRTLKSVIQETALMGVPGGIMTDSETSLNPKKYFVHGFVPHVNSREALDAYTNMRVDAAVLYQLNKEKENLDQMYEMWVNRLTELRKGLRNSRRVIPRLQGSGYRDGDVSKTQGSAGSQGTLQDYKWKATTSYRL
eukprot:Gregarina_sp_Poly_1__1222@NODE_129_length_13257_cov_57_196588_g115_i0_p4_GENE_NODE_129_length_13257_cov_57_196588_g115_i0NODE_129_length_13257_cov_57_196588_g115_i0_p4_ORF_typecomplete_len522_score57_56SANT_DAMP1_like/PF16282_5/3_1e18CENPF_leu_zip/PF10473_9/1_1e02CENPF_leu_zip/PF10473_9/0_023KxDL/PF10241_9/14KxDL/PF10241_9/2_7_NODE_129_length_13257_cov_57_196588_g115_i0960911174